MCHLVVAAVLLTAGAPAPLPAEQKPENGFAPLFDGMTLKGWVVGAEAKKAWAVGSAKVLRCKGSGGAIWTAKSYGDFELLFDLKAPGEADYTLVGLGNGTVLALPDTAGRWSRLRLRVRRGGLKAWQDGKPVAACEPEEGPGPVAPSASAPRAPSSSGESSSAS
jgi:hypothetical protein